MERRITDNIDKLMRVLPININYALEEHGDNNNLLEVVMDLGRVPTARYVNGEVVLSDKEITREDLDKMAARIGEFDADNRAGMERTLHRISAIRNRKGEIIGVTCRIGRAVYGTIDIIEDLVKSGRSVLMLGAPGVGKTTMLREVARVLAEEKRVVIVDTSNEIGGDGDVPHPAVGKARRMQVSHPERQHEVMIEAVENHNPEVIVIDEIGREMEAMAARTIAERGVQLIGTAHGNTMENLMLNPTLSDLVGGIESVTLSDDEARRRGTQKTVLERRSPPTFEILVEIRDRDTLSVHNDVAESVDSILRGRPLPIETRQRRSDGTIDKHEEALKLESSRLSKNGGGPDKSNGVQRTRMVRSNQDAPISRKEKMDLAPDHRSDLTLKTVYAYGVARNRLVQAAKRLNVPLEVSEHMGEAQAVVTLKSYYRNRPKAVSDAEKQGKPLYVLRANTVSQMENFLVDLFKLEERKAEDDPFDEAILEAEQAIMRIRSGQDAVVDLAPQVSEVRKQQHRLARRAQLTSRSHGDEPKRHVRIYGDAV
ncbi:AAA family ATPase [Phototrophicus methaneseepsis]|uniref:AAA family ATPase n=1 Tax=Phototrophicus methaneseepsis TaxID=2710758 RepID=A0A7S8IG19_9CHLR|nr:R3H domain-containing nucleic acid-binding protein [Phototrophicus methaneseepsis]QPC84211.1 AAA family ATPase [Phototrophicus methaneseepsis]